ncbi:MAG: MlaA lipoprotein, partial [Betaproteobacteria bacterium]|nr:MlaA lipoprotein [Betaproteobacteria bacterium]
VIRPAAVVYDNVLPSPVKTGVGNFFSNLGDLGNLPSTQVDRARRQSA